MRVSASRHSSVARVIGTSGSAMTPSVPASGSNNAPQPATQATRGPHSRIAMRTTSQGSPAPTSRNSERAASALSPNSSPPRRIIHAVSPGRSE